MARDVDLEPAVLPALAPDLEQHRIADLGRPAAAAARRPRSGKSSASVLCASTRSRSYSTKAFWPSSVSRPVTNSDSARTVMVEASTPLTSPSHDHRPAQVDHRHARVLEIDRRAPVGLAPRPAERLADGLRGRRRSCRQSATSGTGARPARIAAISQPDGSRNTTERTWGLAASPACSASNSRSGSAGSSRPLSISSRQRLDLRLGRLEEQPDLLRHAGDQEPALVLEQLEGVAGRDRERDQEHAADREDHQRADPEHQIGDDRQALADLGGGRGGHRGPLRIAAGRAADARGRRSSESMADL